MRGTIAGAQQNSIKDQAAMDKLMASIPVNSQAMPYKTLLERLDNLGVTSRHVMYGAVAADYVQIDPALIKRGDVIYTIFTTQPSESAKKDCVFRSRFTLTKRGDHWLVSDRTGNFLLHYQCGRTH